MTDLDADPTEHLLERGTELEALNAAVATAAAGDGLLVTIEGPAGIGKSALLAAARESARRAGLRTLTASGSELERDFGFSVVRRLFEEAVDPAGPTPIALAPAGAEPGAADPVEATYAALNGLYRLTERLSEDRPLALLVDDLHWTDAASLRYLAYLARRLESVPVLVVGAVRTPVPEGTPHPAAVLGASTPRLIEPAPLSPAGTGRLVRSIAGDVDETTADACYEATGGSPFYARELALALQDSAGLRADALEATPARIVRSVSTRISALPAPARALAATSATLGAGASLRLAAELAGLDAESAGAAADALRAAGILSQDSALQFTHPIVLAAARESIPLGARSTSHASAARLLHAEGAGSERVATHVAATEPMGDAWAVEQLGRAGADALASGAPEAAMTSLRRALLEPPPPEALPSLLGMLGLAEALSGQPEPAAEHLRTALELAGDPAERTKAGFALAGVLTQGGRGDESLAVLEALLDDVGDDTPAALRIEAELANHSRFGVAIRKRAGAAAERLTERVEAQGSDDPAVLASAAAELAMAGRAAPRVRELSLRALAAIETPRIGTGDFSAGIAIRSLTVADGLAEANRALTAIMEGAAERGVGPEWAQASVFRADNNLRRGAVLDAEDAPAPPRATLLFELGKAELALRDATAVATLREALELKTDRRVRARIAATLAELFSHAGRWEEMLALLETTRREIGEDDEEALVEIDAVRAAALVWTPNLVGVFDRERPRLEKLAEGNSWPAHALAALIGCALAYRGEDVAHARELLRRVGRAGVLVGGRGGGAWAGAMLTSGLWALDEFDESLEFAAEISEAGRRSGSLVAILGGSLFPGFAKTREGDLVGAEADMRVTMAAAVESGMPMWLLTTLHVFVDVLIERPGLEDMRQTMEAVEIEDAFLDSLAGATLLEPRGRVRVSRGDREGGIADLRRAVTTIRALRIGPMFSKCRSELALALPATARAEARALAEEELAIARNAGLPRPEGVALRAVGLLEGGEAGVELLRESLGCLERSPARLEQARSLVELGAALRRRKLRMEAREHLTAGLDLAYRCGALRLAEHAEEELRTAGARPRRRVQSGVEALTASELRVAELAAQGHTNVEIAQQLFVSAKTVESHLSNSYRKLGLAGQGARSRLAEALAA